MLNIKSLTAKNFMSIGNVSQAISFNKQQLTLILGENLDLGGDSSGSKNGTGKTTILNALSYGLYGQALTNIKRENLINKINGKNMLVTVEFEKDNVNYRIERGRKPNVLKLFIDNKEQESASSDDESQGDSRETQRFIDHCLNMSHIMFKHLIALNTYTEPFLSMKAADQREVIEQLLGITLLSEKAELLKAQSKEVRDKIQVEQIRIESVKNSNDNIQKSIDSLIIKSKAWNSKKETDIKNLADAIATLENVDIQQELDNHAALKNWEEKSSQLKELRRQYATYQTAQPQAEKNVARFQKDIEVLSNRKCPQCEQNLKDHTHKDLINAAERNLTESNEYLNSINQNLSALELKIKDVSELGPKPVTFYDIESDALNHKSQLDHLKTSLENKIEEINPYQDQIEELTKTAIQDVDWNNINILTNIKDHQEFLLKLLTNKDSFIRKKIIDQNLNYLNKRLNYYIDSLGLPHLVTFQNDLTVEITNYGQDLDFDNLSRGERNRLILGMSFAFRDVWENLYQNINLLFVDELIDNGLDSAGVEAGLAILKKLARERKKNIYLISHKEELVGRVNNVLKVIKESGFTSYSNSSEYIEVQ